MDHIPVGYNSLLSVSIDCDINRSKPLTRCPICFEYDHSRSRMEGKVRRTYACYDMDSLLKSLLGTKTRATS